MMTRRRSTSVLTLAALYFCAGWQATALAQTKPSAAASAAQIKFDRNIQPRAQGDEIIAIVGDDIVTRNEMNHRVMLNENEIKSRGGKAPERAELEKATLDALINERVLVQYAKRIGIIVDTVALDSTIERIAASSRLTVDELLQKVQNDGLTTERFREGIRNEIYLSTLREQLTTQARITDAEIEQFINERLSQSTVAPQIELAQVFVPLAENADTDAVARAEKIMAEVQKKHQSGTSFEELAKQYSQAPEAKDGGSLGLRESSKFPQLFIEATNKLKVGELSDMVRSPAGLHLLKLLGSKTPEAKVVLPQVRARRIVMSAQTQAEREAVIKKLTSLRQQIKQGQAKFSEAALDLSIDAASARKGGDMGWQVVGQGDPQVGEILKKLEPGDVSDPVVVEGHVEIYQLLNREARELDKPQLRAIAMSQLRDQKRVDALDNALREAKPHYYIEIRDY